MRVEGLLGVVAALILAAPALADPEPADERPLLGLGTTGGATYSGGAVFFMGEIDVRAQFANHARAAFTVQTGPSANPACDPTMPGIGGGTSNPCPTPYYFATFAGLQYDVTRASDSNIWFGVATGVPFLIAGDLSSGVIAAIEMTIDIRLSRYLLLELGARGGVEWISAWSYVPEGAHGVGDVRLGFAFDLTRSRRVAPQTASR